MNKSQITIKDIARELNISISTVSRALKNSKEISEETRRRVNEYATRHHYQPNALAANLRTSRSNTIGVIVPQIVHYFFSSVLSGIEQAARKAGYNIMVAQSGEHYEQEVEITQSFFKARVCGVITSLAKETNHYEHYQKLLDHNVPIVFYDRICPALKTERVVVDDYHGAYTAVEYLIKTGCRHIYFYSADPHLEISKNRRNGYIDAMKRYNVPVTPEMIVWCDTREKAMQITPSMLQSDTPPDGFFAINNDTAAGILNACKAMGKRVPDEVAICGFSDDDIARSTDPKLTTVEQRGEEVGKSAFDILHEKIEGKTDGKNRIVKTNLVVRGTTR